MKEGHTKYGFLSTYNQTAFLKQEFVDGKWRLFVSDIVKSDASSGSRPTLRQCFWYLLNQLNYSAFNETPDEDWVVCEKSK